MSQSQKRPVVKMGVNMSTLVHPVARLVDNTFKSTSVMTDLYPHMLILCPHAAW